jgi:hypothetical protein
VFFFSNKASNTRFLVAKYIPDMRRLEPRNIGVIVWVNGHLSARFLGEHPESPGTVRIPRRLCVQSRDTYCEWIQFWRSQMASPMLDVAGGSQRVSRESPQFVDALQKRSKQNFVLVDGGFIPGEVSPLEIDEVVNDLFTGLVEEEGETGESQEEDSLLLKKAVSRVCHESGIDGVNGYQTKIPLAFSVDSHMFSFTFDSAIYTTAPRAVFQHAMLTRPMTVNSAAFMFSCLARSDFQPYRVSRNCCLSVVRTTPALLKNEAAFRELDKLKAYSTVLDVADEERSINELRELSLSL